MPIDPASLTNPQYHGLACVVCRHPFTARTHRTRVGLLGDDLHPVYACSGGCARQVDELVMQRNYTTCVLPPIAASRSVDPQRPDRDAVPTPAGPVARPDPALPGQLPAQDTNQP